MANETTTLNTIIQLRADTTENWEKSTVKLLSGEMGLEYLLDGTVKIKAGKTVEVDGKKEGTLWKDLQYVGSDVKESNVFQSQTPEAFDSEKDDNQLISEMVGTTEIQAGDMAIVKRYIIKDDTTKISYTSYVYDSEHGWEAMDGNYTADNVYFKNDITLAGNYDKVGNITKSSDGAILNAKGQSLAGLFESIFTQDTYPAENPSGDARLPNIAITITANDSNTKEVGESFTAPSAKVTISDVGAYDFGPATGITFDSVTISCLPPKKGSAQQSGDAESKTDSTGGLVASYGGLSITAPETTDQSFKYVYQDDVITYNFSASGVYTASSVNPKTKLGKVLTDDKYKIKGGTASASKTVTFTGYRKNYYGTLDTPTKFSTAEADKIATSNAIRNKSVTGNSGKNKSVTINAKGKNAIFVAVPGTKAASNFTISYVDAFGVTQYFTKKHVETIKVGGYGSSDTEIKHEATYTILYMYDGESSATSALPNTQLEDIDYTISWS